VDHHVEPQTWFTDGSAESSAADPEPPQVSPDSEAAEAADDGSTYSGPNRRGNSYPGNGPVPHGNAYPGGPGMFAGGGPAMSDHGDDNGFGGSPYERPAPPYPSQVQSGAPTGMAARVTAQLAALTRPKPKPSARPPRPGQTGPMPRVAVSARGPVRGAPTRRAQLTVARIEPWSVMKFSFMVSLVGWVVLFVAVAFLYYVLSKLGVFHSIEDTISDVTSSKGSAGDDASGQWFSASRILGYTMLIGAINVVLFTALATIGAVIYNLVTHLAGGIEITLKESD
jgi:transmembrane protein DUF3566